MLIRNWGWIVLLSWASVLLFIMAHSKYLGSSQPQTQSITDQSTSARLLEMSFEKRLQVLGEGLKQAAVNQSIIFVPINSGMARLMFNLRCSLLALHIQPVLYFAYDLQIFAHLVDVLKEPFVLYNDSAFHTEKLEYYEKGTYNKQMQQRLPVMIWILRDLDLSFWLIDADVFVFKEFRHFADANYAFHPNSPFNPLYKKVKRLPDVVVQIDEMNTVANLSHGRDMMPQGCFGFFFMRNTANSLRLLYDAAHVLAHAHPDWHDQETYYHLFRDTDYARYLDLHPKHPQSFLYKEKGKKTAQPVVLVKFLPQLQFINGHALRNFPPEDDTDFYIVHANGWGMQREPLLKRLGAWKLDDYNRCT